MELRTELEERLRQILIEELPGLELQFNRFLTWESITGLTRLDAALSKGSSAEEKLADFIGEEPVSDFIAGVVQDDLWDREFESDADRRKLLKSTAGYEDETEVADRLLAELKNLPRHYHLFSAVPHFIRGLVREAMDGDGFDLSGTFSLVTGTELEETYPKEPPESAARAGLFPRSVGVSASAVYLGADVRGFIPNLGFTRPLEEFSAAVRAFYGLGIALRLFRGGSAPPGQVTERPVLVFEMTAGDGYQFREPHQLGADVNRGIEGMRADSLRDQLGEEHAAEFARHTLRVIRDVFSANVQSTEGVLRAAQWLFDSHGGGNQLLSYVQATVALEILLGNKAASDEIGLGELLRNRCAYLIGNSRSQREEILEDFRRIYSTRSRIVHRGKSRLNRSDLRDLSRLRWMCGRVIQEEVKLIRADAEEATYGA